MPAYGRTVDKKLLLSVTGARQTYLQNRAQNATADLRNYHSQVGFPSREFKSYHITFRFWEFREWFVVLFQFHDFVVKMETLFRRPSPAGNPKLDELDRQTGLLIRSPRFASSFLPIY